MNYQGEDFIWGYGQGQFNLPSVGNAFYFKIRSPTTFSSMREEVNMTIEKIVSDYHGLPIVLGFSGGYDSQAIALGLLHCGVPFTAALSIYTDKGQILNQIEVSNAEAFCYRHGIRLDKQHISLSQFMLGALEKISKTVPLHWIKYLHLHSSLKYKGCLYLLGNGDPIFSPDSAHPLDITLTPDLTHLANELDLAVIDRFFYYRSELFFSRYFHPYLQSYGLAAKSMQQDYEELTKDKPNSYGFLAERYVKPIIFADEYPDGSIDHNRKLNGLESYEDYFFAKDMFSQQAKIPLTTSCVTVTHQQWCTLRDNPNKHYLRTVSTPDLTPLT